MSPRRLESVCSVVVYDNVSSKFFIFSLLSDDVNSMLLSAILCCSSSILLTPSSVNSALSAAKI